VYLFREGMSVESMVDSHPVLTLEQVHGALAFYLGNQKKIDAYLADGECIAESQHEQSRQTNAEFDCQAAAGASCESDSRLTPILTDASFAGCGGLRQELTSGRRPTPDSRVEGSEVLRIAADSGRILVSQDRRTMPLHFNRHVTRAESPGVILLREAIPISTAIEELALIWSASEAAEWINRLVWIPL